jgi:hypothetical protein
MTDEILDMVNDLIVDHEFEIIEGADFDKYTVTQYESDYDMIDAGYGLFGTIKVGKTVYEGANLKISIDWSCMVIADDDFGGEDYEDFAFDYNVEQICDFHNTEIISVSYEENDKSLLKELAEDIIVIIHSFSGKLYGMKHKIVKAIDKIKGD